MIRTGTAELVASTAGSGTDITQLIVGGAVFIALSLLLVNLFWNNKFLRSLYGIGMVAGVTIATLIVGLISYAEIAEQSIVELPKVASQGVFILITVLLATMLAVRVITIGGSGALYASRKGLGDDHFIAARIPLVFIASNVICTAMLGLIIIALYTQLEVSATQYVLFGCAVASAIAGVAFLYAYIRPTPAWIPPWIRQKVYVYTVKKPNVSSAIILGAISSVPAITYVLLPLSALLGISAMLSISGVAIVTAFTTAQAALYCGVLVFLAVHERSSATLLTWVRQSRSLMTLSIGLALLALGWIAFVVASGNLPL